jgi:hypothetical protein
MKHLTLVLQVTGANLCYQIGLLFVSLRSWRLKAPDKQLRVKANLCHRPGVKGKASTKFIERIGKHPDGWDWVKELSQRMAEVHEIK